jgi:hypothetical protein
MPVIEALEQVDDEQADEVERKWIQALGGDGLLTNTEHYQPSRNPPLAYVDRLWPDEKKGPYYVRIELGIVNGTLDVTSYRVAGDVPTCDPPWTGRTTGAQARLSGRDLQKVPVHRIAREARDELRSRWAPVIVAQSRSESARAAANALMATPGPRRGRPALYGPSHWREVAVAYRRATRAPVKAVAEHFSVSPSLARKWVERARRDGYLDGAWPS